MNPSSDLVATLACAGQQHLLAFWSRLDEPAQRSFALQLEAVDWTLVEQMRRLAAGDGNGRSLPVDLSAAITPSCLRLGNVTNRIPPADAIRREIGQAIGGEGPQRWLTIDFTTDPSWL